MARIHELSVTLSNQIAAGEVIERPASVVKELLENALDAKATQIDILIEEAGVKKIEIIDNGVGIEASDVELAFKRHATSKISDRRDLFKVKTLGFRGEALPSIASIADVILTTSTGQAAGKLIHFKGGELIKQSEASFRRGTSIKVSELFFNTPARLKYLKSKQTELAKIVDIVNRLAFSYPKVTFNLVNNGKQMLKTTGNGDVKRVIADIYGIDNAKKMIDIQAKNTDFVVKGYVSLPELTRSSRDYISILINNRYIKNFQLTKAIIKGYGSKLMVGRYPFAVIDIQMDPLLVDVNVHPTKQEVRLSQEDNLMELLQNAINEALSNLSLIPDGYKNLMAKDTTKNKNISNENAFDKFINNDSNFVNQLNQASSKYIFDKGTVISSKNKNNLQDEQIITSVKKDVTPILITNKNQLNTPTVIDFKKRYKDDKSLSIKTNEPTAKTNQLDLMTEDEITFNNTKENKIKNEWPEFRYIGQMFGTFLFAEGPSGLYFIDQHAAQERINYEFYRKEIGNIGTTSQQMLIPLVLDYPTVDFIKINDKLQILRDVGLDLESFGDNSFILHHHPSWFVKGQEESTTREMIDWVLKVGNLTTIQFREKTAIMMSCKRAIKANQHLSDLEAKALIVDLGKTKNPFNCPHGRPVLVTLSLTDMEKMFKRIQDSHESWVDYDNHPY